jgi:hypothetical protein
MNDYPYQWTWNNTTIQQDPSWQYNTPICYTGTSGQQIFQNVIQEYTKWYDCDFQETKKIAIVLNKNIRIL